MDVFIGLDIGTSKLSGVALDGEGKTVAGASRPNDADVDGLPSTRHEQTADRLYVLAVDILREFSEALGERAKDIRAIALTGQMHGAVLVDERLKPATNLITWRDGRATETLEAGERTYLDELRARAGDGAFADTGTHPAAGFMGATLFWFTARGDVPAAARWALQVHDWIAAKLAGAEPVTDATDAASTALFNVKKNAWDERIIGSLDLDARMLPRVVEAGSELGRLSEGVARATGLPAATTVHAALGDNQASVLASLREPATELLLNIGTGGQISAVTPKFFTASGVEARPFPGGKFLSVAVSLCSGAAFTYLADHYAAVTRKLTGQKVSREDVLAKLVKLASRVPPGADGLTVEPFFLGKRHDPSARGRISGMSAENNTPGHWALAFLEGVVEELVGGYRAMLACGLEPRERLIGSGNGLRKNRILRRAAAAAVDMPLAVPAWHEEAACGAALAGMVGAGAVGSFEEAARFVRYASDSDGV